MPSTRELIFRILAGIMAALGLYVSVRTYRFGDGVSDFCWILLMGWGISVWAKIAISGTLPKYMTKQKRRSH